jgi:hypothetical protein
MKDDRRNPLIRVMSGLPILNLIVPPFEPQHLVASIESVGSAFAKADKNIFSVYTAKKPTSFSDAPSSLSVAMAAACGGIVAEVCLGKKSALASPFASQHPHIPSRHVVPVFQYEGAAVLKSIRSKTIFPVNSSGAGGIPLTGLARSGAFAFFLFGSKATLEKILFDKVEVNRPLAGVAASASAGILQAFSKGVTGHYVTFSREVAAVTVYFSVYEGFKHLLNKKETRDRPSMLACAISGAAAGVSSVYVRGNSYLVAKRAMPFASISAHRISLAALRAAPYHALLFVGFETASSLLTH